MSAPLLALSNLIVDDICRADGAQRRQLGGAGLYAALGAAFWWPEVALVAGVGADLDDHAQGALARWGLRDEGLLVRDAHTIGSRLVYRDDGERTETPWHGPEHFERLQLGPAQIPAALLPAAGCYLFQGLRPAYWDAYAGLRDRLGVTLWELSADAARPECWPAVRARLQGVDVFSLNRTEALALLGAAEPRAAAAALLDAGARCIVLRLGADGALVADARSMLRLRPPPGPVVDVTGAGNAFCGGFLAGRCRHGGDLEAAARCAAASAALTIAQHGPPDPRRAEALHALAAAARIDALPR
ncbi:MAG: carbohydrate kinase family protein [Rubrivivax sp.]